MSLKGAAAIVVATLLVDSLVEQLVEVRDGQDELLHSCLYLLPVLGVTLVALKYIFRSDDEKYLSRIAVAIIAFSLLCRVIWISFFDSYQINDFGMYLNEATDFSQPTWRRCAFYTYPLVLLFGRSLLAVKIANVLLVTTTAWIFFLAGRVIFGAQVSTAALVFFIWQPDLWYVVTLASPDVPGLFWLGLYFYISALLLRGLLAPVDSRRSSLVLSAGLGIVLFFLAATRSYHYGAILALTVYCVFHVGLLLYARKQGTGEIAGWLESRFPQGASLHDRLRLSGAHAVALVLIPVSVYISAEKGFEKLVRVQPDTRRYNLGCYVTAMDVLGTSDYDQITNWYEEQCPSINTEDRGAFAVRKLLHDVTHSPEEYFLHLERKNRVMAMAYDYIDWSTSTTYESWDATHEQVKHVNQVNLDAQRLMAAIGCATVLLLVMWRLALYPKVTFRWAEAIPILFSAIYYGVFLCWIEVQPRYHIFLIYLLSWMAALPLQYVHLRRTGKPDRRVGQSGPRRVSMYLAGGALLALLVTGYVVAARLVAGSYFTLRDQSGFVSIPPGQLPEPVRGCHQIEPVFVRNNYKDLMLSYPVGTGVRPDSVIAVQRSFVVKERPHHHLRFFLSTFAVTHEPFADSRGWDDTDLEYLVACDGRVIATGKVKEIPGNRYFSFDSIEVKAPSSGMTLQLIIRNAAGIAEASPTRGPIIALQYVDFE